MIKNRFILLVSSFLIVSVMACHHEKVADSVLSRADTLTILQTALDDEELIRAAVLYFPERPLKVIQNKIVRPDYRLNFNNQPVNFLAVKEQELDITEAYPKQLIANFTMFKAMHRDTVVLVRIVYPGNGTDIYKMCRKYSGFWGILSDQKGKL